MPNQIPECQDSALSLRRVTNITVMLVHGARYFGPFDDRWNSVGGTSSPANPALQMLLPLSTTSAATSSSVNCGNVN